MKSILILSLLISLVVPFSPLVQCSCQQMKIEEQCNKFNLNGQTCTWKPDPKEKPCKPKASSNNSNLVSYCGKSTNCAKTNGCALVQGKCINFAGCSAYIGSTAFECQAISLKCVSDGNSCIDAKTCTEYQDEKTCSFNSEGVQCIFINKKCQYKQCENADESNTTDAQCQSFAPNCLTTGAGCVNSISFPTCSQLKKGSSINCPNMIGSDGKCVYDSGSKCRVRTCQDAPEENITDQQCNDYLQGCVTKGKGCRGSYQICSDLSVPCDSSSGYDGNCKTSSSKCILKPCTDDKSSKTNEQCMKIQTSCVTTGLGCIESKDLQLCSSYNSDCDQRIGSDGKCTSSTTSQCTLRVCSESKIKSIEGCSAYQYGCVYDDNQCIQYNSCNLPKSDAACKGTIENTVPCGLSEICVNIECSSQKGNKSDCEKFKICTNTEDAQATSPCIYRKCELAKLTSYTDQACTEYLSECLSKGDGCIKNTQKCSGYSGSQEICKIFTGSSDGANPTPRIPCWQTNTSGPCTERKCEFAEKQTDNDSCEQFLSGCIYNGNGSCVKTGTLCSEIQLPGNNSGICEKIKVKMGAYEVQCVNDTNNQCRAKKCEDKPSSGTLTDKDCSDFLVWCKSSNNKCVDPTISIDKLCSSYTGTQSECETKTGNYGQDQCWSAQTTSGVCKKKQCTDFTKQDCDNQKNSDQYSCLFNGISCGIASDTLCKDFQGDKTACANFKASDSPCYLDSNEKCAKKVCTLAPKTFMTDEECKNYHGSCVTTGAGCIAAADFYCQQMLKQSSCVNASCMWNQQCRVTPIICKELSPEEASVCSNTKLSNGQSCVWRNKSCQDQNCEDFTLTNHLACNKKNSICTTSGQGCVTMDYCNNYTEAVCENANSLDEPYRCSWKEKSCQPRRCEHKKFESDSECNGFLAGCRTTGSECFNPAEPYDCTKFQKENICLLDSTPCIYYESTCQNFSKCEDLKYSDFKKCQEISPFCVADEKNCMPIQKCDLYQKEKQCKLGSDSKICTWRDGKCKSLDSCSDTKGINSDQCTKLITGWDCVSNGQECVPKMKCSDYQKNKTSCEGGGTDGDCVFNESCQLFKSCKQALDEKTCKKNPSCYYEKENCKPKLCQNDNAGCDNLPNFSGKISLICLEINKKCQAIDPVVLDQSSCLEKSKYMYTWNNDTLRCETCKELTTVTTQITNSTVINYGHLIVLFLIAGLLG